MVFTKAFLFLAFAASAAYGILAVGDPCAPDCLYLDDFFIQASPLDCQAFYKCSHHLPYLYYCHAGLYYNPKIKVCDYPENVECTADPSFDCEAVQPSTAAPTAAPGETTTPAPTLGPDYGDPCAPNCLAIHNALLPHPQECGLFFQCSHDLPYLHTCPENLHWNQATLQCDFPESAGCTAVPDPSVECNEYKPPGL